MILSLQNKKDLSCAHGKSKNHVFLKKTMRSQTNAIVTANRVSL